MTSHSRFWVIFIFWFLWPVLIEQEVNVCFGDNVTVLASTEDTTGTKVIDTIGTTEETNILGMVGINNILNMVGINNIMSMIDTNNTVDMIDTNNTMNIVGLNNTVNMINTNNTTDMINTNNTTDMINTNNTTDMINTNKILDMITSSLTYFASLIPYKVLVIVFLALLILVLCLCSWNIYQFFHQPDLSVWQDDETFPRPSVQRRMAGELDAEDAQLEFIFANTRAPSPRPCEMILENLDERARLRGQPVHVPIQLVKFHAARAD